MNEEPKYFIVTSNDVDGPFSKAELTTALAPDDDGETWFGLLRGFCDSMPHDARDIHDGYAVIFKGEVIVPKALSAAAIYELP